MKKLLSVVIALMMMVTFVFAEEAAPAEVKTLYAGVLTVGCEAGYPPFEMVADDGESVVGLDMDIMAAVAEKLGLQMQVVTTSFDGIFDGIGVNYDVVCSAVTITPDRMQNMLFSLPYITNYQAVVVPADKDVEINSFMDLDGYVIGVQKGTTADILMGDYESTHQRDRGGERQAEQLLHPADQRRNSGGCGGQRRCGKLCCEESGTVQDCLSGHDRR